MENILDQRFICLKKNELVKISGALTDTTTFEMLVSVLVDKSICDLSGITFASWIGLDNFCNYIKKNNLNLVFIRIPNRLWKVLRFQKSILDHIEIKESEIEYYSVENNEIKSSEIKTIDLTNIETTNQTDFLNLDEKTYIHMPIQFLNSLRFEEIESERTGLSSWHQKNSEQSTFWYNILSYIESSLYLSIDLVKAAQFNIAQYQQAIGVRYESAEKASKIIDSSKKFNLAGELLKNGDKVFKICKITEDAIKENYKKCHKFLLNLERQIRDPNFLEDSFKVIQEFSQTIVDLTETTKKIEQNGQDVGTLVMSIPDTREFKKMLGELSEIEDDKLESVRDAFNILDIMSEDDWELTKEEIFTELDSAEKDIESCVVTLQTFDITRQVLEHIQSEATIILEYKEDFSNPDYDWKGLRDKIFDRIKSTLVTDQEKLAFGYFFPQTSISEKQEDNAHPGEVLMF